MYACGWYGMSAVRQNMVALANPRGKHLALNEYRTRNLIESIQEPL
jgi:hypothetical protein